MRRKALMAASSANNSDSGLFPLYIKADSCDKFRGQASCTSTSLDSALYETLFLTLHTKVLTYGETDSYSSYLDELQLYGIDLYVEVEGDFKPIYALEYVSDVVALYGYFVDGIGIDQAAIFYLMEIQWDYIY